MSLSRITKNKIQKVKADRKLLARKRGFLILFTGSPALIPCHYCDSLGETCVIKEVGCCSLCTMADRRAGRCNAVLI